MGGVEECGLHSECAEKRGATTLDGKRVYSLG